MSSFYTILGNVHANAHDLPMKLFTEPKIYTGGVDVTNWGKLTAKKKKKHCQKDGTCTFLTDILKLIYL
jgi:hypothetical protein